MCPAQTCTRSPAFGGRPPQVATSDHGPDFTERASNETGPANASEVETKKMERMSWRESVRTNRAPPKGCFIWKSMHSWNGKAGHSTAQIQHVNVHSRLRFPGHLLHE